MLQVHAIYTHPPVCVRCEFSNTYVHAAMRYVRNVCIHPLYACVPGQTRRPGFSTCCAPLQHARILRTIASVVHSLSSLKHPLAKLSAAAQKARRRSSSTKTADVEASEGTGRGGAGHPHALTTRKLSPGAACAASLMPSASAMALPLPDRAPRPSQHAMSKLIISHC